MGKPTNKSHKWQKVKNGMSTIQQIDKWVCGVVNISPIVGKEYPYTFFEIDNTDTESYNLVVNTYLKYNIDMFEHRCGAGYHFFGSPLNRDIWKKWYSEIKHLNPKWPPLTLRISRKFPDEVFERPVYHQVNQPPPNWAKATMHFLNKEMKGQNSSNLHESMKDCGLEKYFKCVVYKITLEKITEGSNIFWRKAGT